MPDCVTSKLIEASVVNIVIVALLTLDPVFEDTTYILVPFPTPAELNVIVNQLTLSEEVQLHSVGDNTLNEETPPLLGTDMLIGVMDRVHSALPCLA